MNKLENWDEFGDLLQVLGWALTLSSSTAQAGGKGCPMGLLWTGLSRVCNTGGDSGFQVVVVRLASSLSVSRQWGLHSEDSWSSSMCSVILFHSVHRLEMFFYQSASSWSSVNSYSGSPRIPLFLNIGEGLERYSVAESTLVALVCRETRIWFTVPTCGLQPFITPWTPSTHMLHINTCRLNTHLLKAKKIKKK